jgi:hypothetical protein
LDSSFGEKNPRARAVRAGLFAAWLVIVLALAATHVFWRDEVRAFSFALQGDTIVEMLRRLHGEGHPALWYLMLRGAHAVVPVREVLPAVAFFVAAAAMALLVWRSPLRLGMIALVLFGAFGLYEYAAVARNYGISMLVLFALAHFYPRYRDRGIVVGALLALLCNTNVPSAMLAASFLLFWLVELIGEEGLRWTRKHWLFLLNAALAALGALLCFLTVFPTMHDAAPIQYPGGIPFKAAAAAILFPAYSFWGLSAPGIPPTYVAGALLGAIVVGSLFGLVRRPGAFLSSLAALTAFELLFQLIYPGFYRHQALLIVYLVAMYWLVAEGRGGRWPELIAAMPRLAALERAGRIVFLLLLAMQVLNSVDVVAGLAKGTPYSRSRDLAELLEREHLGDAILIGDPDMYLEPMPYYTRNPIYLMREQRFGPYVHFTRHVRLSLTPDDYLADARALRARTGRPVVVVLQHKLDPRRPHYSKSNVRIWWFSADSEQVRRFQAATRKLASFGPAITDETYDVYLVRS